MAIVALLGITGNILSIAVLSRYIEKLLFIFLCIFNKENLIKSIMDVVWSCHLGLPFEVVTWVVIWVDIWRCHLGCYLVMPSGDLVIW
jgi:hypothetical protein